MAATASGYPVASVVDPESGELYWPDDDGGSGGGGGDGITQGAADARYARQSRNLDDLDDLGVAVGHLDNDGDLTKFVGTFVGKANVILYTPSLTPEPGDTLWVLWRNGAAATPEGTPPLPQGYETLQSYTWSGTYQDLSQEGERVLLMLPGDDLPTVYASVTADGFVPIPVTGGTLITVNCAGGAFGDATNWIGANEDGAVLGGSTDTRTPATFFRPQTTLTDDVFGSLGAAFSQNLSGLTGARLTAILQRIDELGFDANTARVHWVNAAGYADVSTPSDQISLFDGSGTITAIAEQLYWLIPTDSSPGIWRYDGPGWTAVATSNIEGDLVIDGKQDNTFQSPGINHDKPSDLSIVGRDSGAAMKLYPIGRATFTEVDLAISEDNEGLLTYQKFDGSTGTVIASSLSDGTTFLNVDSNPASMFRLTDGDMVSVGGVYDGFYATRGAEQDNDRGLLYVVISGLAYRVNAPTSGGSGGVTVVQFAMLTADEALVRYQENDGTSDFLDLESEDAAGVSSFLDVWSTPAQLYSAGDGFSNSDAPDGLYLTGGLSGVDGSQHLLYGVVDGVATWLNDPRSRFYATNPEQGIDAATTAITDVIDGFGFTHRDLTETAGHGITHRIQINETGVPLSYYAFQIAMPTFFASLPEDIHVDGAYVTARPTPGAADPVGIAGYTVLLATPDGALDGFTIGDDATSHGYTWRWDEQTRGAFPFAGKAASSKGNFSHDTALFLDVPAQLDDNQISPVVVFALNNIDTDGPVSLDVEITVEWIVTRLRDYAGVLRHRVQPEAHAAGVLYYEQDGDQALRSTDSENLAVVIKAIDDNLPIATDGHLGYVYVDRMVNRVANSVTAIASSDGATAVAAEAGLPGADGWGAGGSDATPLPTSPTFDPSQALQAAFRANLAEGQLVSRIEVTYTAPAGFDVFAAATDSEGAVIQHLGGSSLATDTADGGERILTVSIDDTIATDGNSVQLGLVMSDTPGAGGSATVSRVEWFGTLGTKVGQWVHPATLNRPSARTVTADGSQGAEDDWVLFDSTDESIDWTLLDPADAVVGRDYDLTMIAGANPVTIIGTVSGTANRVLSANETLTIRTPDGSDWYAV